FRSLAIEACRKLNVPGDYYAEVIELVSVNVFKGAETFRGEQMAQFIEWTREIARNAALGLKQERSKRMQREVGLDEVPDPPSSGLSPEQILDFRQLTARMVKSLRMEERMIFILKAVAEFTFSEIADMLDMSRSDVQRKYTALIERLRKRFSR